MSEQSVPVNDLVRAVDRQRPLLDSAIADVLDSGWLVLGPHVGAFETELASYLGVPHAVGVANGTDALVIGLLSLGCQPGDLVVTAANAGGYASTAIHAIGAVPVYVDVDEQTALLSPATLEPALELDVRAVVVTHLFGAMADVESIVELCHERGVAVLEDVAQAIGAERNGRKAGSLADVAALSFYPTKNLGALGDGGAVTTHDGDRADVIRQLRQYGWSTKYCVERAGGRNSRLDEIQAAILRTRLPLLDGQNRERREIFSRYAQAVSTARFFGSADASFVAHLAVLHTPDRDRVRRKMAAAGIGTDVHYPIPDHHQPVAVDFRLASPLPVTERLAGTVLTVPCFPELTAGEAERVCEVLAEL